jgi:D-beta-D-heptose 7-phosphate kinase/D-beta-D-heptose 1-phosphate adenosyltransferase
MKNEIFGIVDKFQGKKIVIFGDVMLDVFVYGMANRISPEAPVPIVEVKYDEYLPGGAANTANNVGSLGGNPILIGVVGDDDNAKRLYKVMDEVGIPTKYLIMDERPTTTKTRIVAHEQQIVRVDRELIKNISKEIEEKVLKVADDLIKNSDNVILSDYNKGFLTDTLCKELIRLCKTYEKIVIVDPKAKFSKYKGAIIITPNEKEFREYSGIADYNVSDVLNVIENNELEAMLITKGKKGMTLYEKNGDTLDIPAINHEYEIVDITGAGDTVIAILGLALSSGASMEEAAKLSNYGAGVVVRKLGTATITIDELKKELERLK